MTNPDRAWPALPRLREWADTQATLHRWMQIVGKIKLALAPPVNHWWHVTLVTTARGLTTTPMPWGAGDTLEIDFDFVDHVCRLRTGGGLQRAIALGPKSVAAFYRETMAALGAFGIAVKLWPMPVEIPGETLRLDVDDLHRSYDAAAVERWWRVLARSDAVLKEFRGSFVGKCSPVHFFWGGFDLAVTRFSGRAAPERPGVDAVTREAYSHEVSSAGFWPGSGPVQEASFYAYAAPAPAGLGDATVRPRAAHYTPEFGGEFLLRYEDVRAAPSPKAALLEFLHSTYDAAATLGRWDRAALERNDAR